MGAEGPSTLRQEDRYFAAPHRDFAKTDEALRIRRQSRVVEGEAHGRESRAFLTYKGPKVDAATKTRTEVETPLGDPEAVAGILGLLGFAVVGKVVKTREVYRRGDVDICLDTVEGLGVFVEVEHRGGGGAAPGSARAAVLGTLERLGEALGPGERRSYLELLLEARGG